MPLQFSIGTGEPGAIVVTGALDVADFAALTERLAEADQGRAAARWDLSQVTRIDTPCALALWRHWNGRRPRALELNPAHTALFERIEQAQQSGDLRHVSDRKRRRSAGASLRAGWQTARDLTSVLGRFLLDAGQVLRRPRALPLRELSAAAYRAGVTALPVVCIVGFLIGVVLSYLSSLQLREYGADSFLPLILGVGVVRELGPLLTAIVIAGRSGSAITAGIAAMRLTQELDALSALGISHSLRLVLPRTLALAIVLPLLVVCTNLAALAGGMLSGWMELDLSFRSFIFGLHRDVALTHLLIGLFKATVFGIAIGLIACLFGLRARANTQSLSAETTNSVVTSISAIILLDALFAILFKDITG